MLLDLLTTEEEKIDNQTRQLNFDIGLLSKRIVFAIDWIIYYPDTKVPVAERAGGSAIISRGGRPDLAGKDILITDRAPTLLLVGGNDQEVLNLNENALKNIKAEKKKITIIPGASQLFQESLNKLLALLVDGRCCFLIQKHGV